MPSKAHRWPGDGHPLSAFHGGSRKAAERAVKLCREPRAPKPAQAPPVIEYGPPPHLVQLLSKLPPVPPYEPRPSERIDRVRPRARKYAGKNERPLLEEIVAIQGGRCAICGSKMLLVCSAQDPLRASFDHVVPRSLGGVNVGNRIAAHRQCNSDKSNRPPTGCERLWLVVVNARLGATDGRSC